MISLYIVTLDQTLKDKKRGRMNKLITVIKWYSKKYAILKIQKKKKSKEGTKKRDETNRRERCFILRNWFT